MGSSGCNIERRPDQARGVGHFWVSEYFGNRTLLDEWAYVRPYSSNNERLLALPDFVDRYNNHRPHTSLKGITPMAALVNNVSGNHI